MGQYFYVLNLDKRQYLNPHCFGDGLKLLEFGCSSEGTMTGLTLLLRKSTEGGGGDFNSDGYREEGIPYRNSIEIVGSWAGDRIAIVGDYDDSKLYQEARESWQNVSHYVLDAMRLDPYLAEAIKEMEQTGFSYISGGVTGHMTGHDPNHKANQEADLGPVPRERLFPPPGSEKR